MINNVLLIEKYPSMSIRKIVWNNRQHPTTIWSYNGNDWINTCEFDVDLSWMHFTNYKYAGNDLLLEMTHAADYMGFTVHASDHVVYKERIQTHMSERPTTSRFSFNYDGQHVIIMYQNAITSKYVCNVAEKCMSIGATNVNVIDCDMLSWLEPVLSDGRMIVAANVDRYVATDIPIQLTRVTDYETSRQWRMTLYEGCLYVYLPAIEAICCRDLRMSDPHTIPVPEPAKIGYGINHVSTCITETGTILSIVDHVVAGFAYDMVVNTFRLSDVRYPGSWYELPVCQTLTRGMDIDVLPD